MLALFRAFSSQCAEMQNAIARGDDHRVDVLDRQMEPTVAAILAYKATNIVEIYMQLKFMSDLIRQESDDRGCVIRRTGALSSLLARYFGNDADAVTFSQPAPIPAQPVFSNDNFLSGAILDSLPDRVAVLTRDYRYLYSNPANTAHLGAAPLDLIGRHIVDVIGNERFEHRAKAKLDLCFSGERVEYDYTLALDDAFTRSVNCRMMPLRDAQGVVIGVLLILRDTAIPHGVLAA